MPAKSPAATFAPVFARLKAILEPYAEKMIVAHDEPGSYCLNLTRPHPRNGQALMFGAVRTGKNYVSFHYMPVYCAPTLLASLSPALKKRMQGKACFNFTTVDEPLFAELAALAKRGLPAFRQLGFA